MISSVLLTLPLRRLLDYMSLLSYSTEVWSIDGPTNHYFHHSQRSRRWLQDLAELILPIEPTEQRVTLVLSQLSSALDTGRPLPAKTQSMEPFLLSQKLKELDPNILHMRHMLELGYSTFAVTEIISSMILHKLDRLVVSVESLVGVVDFTQRGLFEGVEKE